MKKNEAYRREKEREHFDALAQRTGEVWWGSTTVAGIRRLERRAGLVREELQAFKDPLVLEIGCGTGAFSAALLKELPLLRLICSDISPKSIEVVRKRYGTYRNACFETADILAKNYNPDTFDCVLGNSILHHLPLYPVIEECFRILKPGGKIIFFEPNMMNPLIAIEKNIPFIGRLLQNTDTETAFFHWSLASMLRQVGFENVSVKPFDFLHPLTPKAFIPVVEKIGLWLERCAFLKYISGSLLIEGSRM